MPFWKVLQIKGYHHIVCTGTSSVPATRRSSVSSPKKYLCTPRPARHRPPHIPPLLIFTSHHDRPPRPTPSPHRSPAPPASRQAPPAPSVTSPQVPMRTPPRAPPPAPHPATAPLHHASRPATPANPQPTPPPGAHSISPGAASPLCYLTLSTYAYPAHGPAPGHPPLPPARPSTYTRLGPVHPLHKLHNLRCRILADVVHTIETDQKSFFKVDDWSVLQYTVGVKQNDERSFLINCQPSPAPNARCTPCSSAR